VQVCDDSTREAVRQKVDAAVISCLEQGHNVQLVRRDNRSGFKAGAMVDGMQRVEDQGFEYVAIFDADFEPPEDFLYQTIIHMVGCQHNDDVSITGCWLQTGLGVLGWLDMLLTSTAASACPDSP
jgi:beta-mannan synthase